MTIADTSLLSGPAAKHAPEAPLIVRVARDHGVSPIAQLWQMWQGRSKKRGLTAAEYYDFEVYKAPDAASRAAFVGVKGSRELNRRLTPPALRGHDSLFKNKMAWATHFETQGIAVPQTQALLSQDADAVENAGDRLLRSADDVCRFLQETAQFPVFAKPAAGSLSVGSARIERLDGATLILGNGGVVDIDAFAAEILRDHLETGFLFQTAIAQHPQMTAMIGPSLGSVRVVTAMVDATRSAPLYALWKIPAPEAMSDNFWQAGSMIAALDMKTGEILSVRRGTGPETEILTHHPITGQVFVGNTLPHWDAVKSIAQQAHDHFPASGAIGWDIGISTDGPIIIEGNLAPFHTLYQLSTGEGLLNARFAPVFDAIAARQAETAREMT